MEISNWIQHHANCSPEKIALYFEGRRISYAQFEYRIAHLAGGLVQTLKVNTGDRVAYLGENAHELLELLFACARIGAIFVPLNARMTIEQHRYYLENSNPRCVFVEAPFSSHVDACIQDSGIKKIDFGNIGAKKSGSTQMCDLISRSKAIPADRYLPDSTPVMIAYTSGSTGMPKGAVLSNETLFYSAINAVQLAKMTADDHILTNLPMFHVGGLTVQTLPALHIGAAVTIHREFDAEATLHDIENKRITVYLPLPKISRALTSHKNWHSADISSLRITQTGSTIVPLSVMTPWTERNIPAQQIYGLTEALPPVIGLPLDESETMAGSMGKPSMYCEVRLVDKNNSTVKTGERGEIWLKGPCVFKEYWNNPQATEKSFTGDWFHTGDIAHADENGYLYMDDRLKNIIIVGSSNVYPADLEHILSECDDIAEAAVVGRPDAEYGEVPVACIQVKQGHSMTAEQVNRLFQGKLATYQYPQEILFVDSFPRTSLGKIQKTEVGQMVQNL
ncbi:MAG: AMP-binding protein [Proteobacteria bacterium]|nr:AMP-binding protein [Pseudomonadota bacterium]